MAGPFSVTLREPSFLTAQEGFIFARSTFRNRNHRSQYDTRPKKFPVSKTANVPRTHMNPVPPSVLQKPLPDLRRNPCRPHYLSPITSDTMPSSNAATLSDHLHSLLKLSQYDRKSQAKRSRRQVSYQTSTVTDYLNAASSSSSETHSSPSLPRRPPKPQIQPLKTSYRLPPPTSNSHTPNESLLIFPIPHQPDSQETLLTPPLSVNISQTRASLPKRLKSSSCSKPTFLRVTSN